MPPDATVRAFLCDDVESLVNLWEDVFPGAKPWNEPYGALCRKINQADDLIFVAEHQGTLVGAVMAGYDGIRGWIYALAVAPEFRRRGAGRQLLQSVEAELQRRGCPKVNLQVREDNTQVGDFYKKCGFGQEARLSFGKRLMSLEDNVERVPDIPVAVNVRLSAITTADREHLLDYLNQTNAFAKQTEAIPYPYTELDADTWLRNATSPTFAAGGQAVWAVRDDAQTLIGCVGLKDYVPQDKAEIGYWLARSYWGQGIMPQVVRTLCRFAFETYQLRRIHARVIGSNQASAKVLTKAGFQIEGRYRKHHCKQGNVEDVVLFGLLLEDYFPEDEAGDTDALG